MLLQRTFCSLLVFFCVFFASHLHAQTYSSGDITATTSPAAMMHDSTACLSTCTVTLDVTIQNSFINDSVIVRDTFGSTPVILYNTTGANPWVINSYPWHSLNGTYDYSVVGGVTTFIYSPYKIINGPDTVFIPYSSYTLTVTNPCSYGTVSGDIYLDNDGDCTFSAGDGLVDYNVYASATCVLTSPGYPSYTNHTWSSGMPGYVLNDVQESWMTSYTVALDPSILFVFPPSACSTGPYTFTTLPQVNVNFPLLCSSNLDMQCYAGAPPTVRPLVPFYMQPTASNMGCDSISGTLVFVKDNRVTYDATLSTNPAVSVSGDTLFWSYTDLTSISYTGGYWNSFISNIHLTPVSTVNTGDTLCFRIYTTVPAGDVNAANNDYTICIPVVNSYDPNIKEVSPQGIGTQGYIPASTPELTYTIHFQNTGSAEAYDISVVDTLDSDVTPSSLKILSTSHTMSPEWLAPNVVKFNFRYIMLPDSNTNEPLSHGYVRFKVNMHSGLTPGTQIKNTAYIYFDANPAVVTNTALNTIANVSAVPKTDIPTYIKVYPNPASDKIFIENLQSGNVSICSMTGSLLIEQTVTGDKATMDIGSLPPGVYMIRIVNGSNTSTRKLVKQ